MNYMFKVFYQVLYLFLMLISIPRPTHLLVQNPPSVPALIVVYLVSRFRGAQFVIDWHNYGFTILSMSLTDGHPFVKLYRWLEFTFGTLSDKSFCVSKAMKSDLERRISVSPTVLYDRPFSFFQTLSLEERHHFWLRFQEGYSEIKPSDTVESETLFTRVVDGKAEKKSDSPVVFISSSSWTEDEDFLLLLNALIDFDRNYAKKLINNGKDLKVLCIITGKGPLKSFFVSRIAQHKFKHTKFLFPWLSAEDYPKILACSTLGICLHMSSSGLDLPMKVVDMFGVELPVVAYDYATISELIKPEQTGKLFSNQAQLVQCLEDVLKDYPRCEIINRYRANLASFREENWAVNWRKNALPMFVD